MCVEKKPITFHNGVEGITGPEEMRSYSTHIVHHVMIKNGLKANMQSEKQTSYEVEVRSQFYEKHCLELCLK